MSGQPGKLFIGGLSFETTDEKLRQYFSRFGTVNDAVVMRDPSTRRSRGFGFCTFIDPSHAESAMAEVDHLIDGRRVEAKWAVPRDGGGRGDGPSTTSATVTGSNASSNATSSRPSSVSVSADRGDGDATSISKKIFVGGLHYETLDDGLTAYFERFGKVDTAQVLFNRETNKSRGFGFVTFQEYAAVDRVLEVKVHSIDGKTVEVKVAVPKNEVPPARQERAASFSPSASRTYTTSVSAPSSDSRPRAVTSLGGGGAALLSSSSSRTAGGPSRPISTSESFANAVAARPPQTFSQAVTDQRKPSSSGQSLKEDPSR
jgi:RNA-binding protein Musashi